VAVTAAEKPLSMLTAVTPADGGDARGTAIEHRQKGGQPLEGRAVADAGWHRDDRAAHQAADNACQRAFHPRDDNDNVGLLQLRQMFEQSVTFASVATGKSAVPAVTIGRTVFEAGGSFCSRMMALASFSYRTLGNFFVFARASKTSGSALVASTLFPLAARLSNILIMCSVVLPGQKMTSGKPRRICRWWSRHAKPKSSYGKCRSFSTAWSTPISPFLTCSNNFFNCSA